MKKDSLVGHLAAAGAYSIFGLNIVFCKDISNSGMVPPFALFTMRAAGATLLFWLISAFLTRERMDVSDLWKVAIASFFGLFTPQITFLYATTMSTTIDISILSTLTPIFTMFIAAVAVKEPVTMKKALGVAISFGGVLFLIFNSVHAPNGVESTSPVGIVLMLLNGLSFAAYLGVFRPLIKKYSVVTFMKWMFLFSLIISLPFSMEEIAEIPFSRITDRTLLEIAFVIVFSTFVAYFLIPVGQKNIRPTLVGMYSYLQPIIASVIAIACGMDVITWQKVLATVMVISGVVLVNRSRQLSSD